MRTIHSERNSRFFCFRSRYAYVSPRSTVSRAWRYVLRRPPTYPLACFMVFLWRRRVLGPPFARGMVSLLARLQVRQQALDRLRVGLVDHHPLAETPLLLAGLVDVDVAQEGPPSAHLPGSGHLEALGGAPPRLHFRHRVSFAAVISRPASSTCSVPRGGGAAR